MSELISSGMIRAVCVSVDAVWCPECKAKPGTQCHAYSGAYVQPSRTHKARLRRSGNIHKRAFMLRPAEVAHLRAEGHLPEVDDG